MITVYSSSTCPKCKVLKMKLDKTKVVYQVNEDMEQMKELGIKSLPMMQIGDELLDFGAAIAFIKNLEAEEK